MDALARTATAMARLARWRVLIVAAGLFVVAAIALFASSASFSIPQVQAACGQAPPDVRFYTSPNAVHQFLTDCGDAGRVAYRNLQVADLFYPAISGLFMASALAMVLTHLARRGSNAVAAAALPLVGAGLDYLENLAAWATLAAFPDRSGPAETLLGMASAAKQTVSWAAGVLLIAGIVAIVTRASWRTRHPDRGQHGPASVPANSSSS